MAKIKLDFSKTSEGLSMPVGIHLAKIESVEIEKNSTNNGKNLKVTFMNEVGETKLSYMPLQDNMFRLKELLVALDLYDADKSEAMPLNTNDLLGEEVVLELKKGTSPVKDKDTGEVRKDNDGNTMFYTDVARIHPADYIGKLDEEEELDLDDDIEEEEEPKKKPKAKAKAKKKKVEEPEEDEDFEDLDDLDLDDEEEEEEEAEEEVKPKKKGKKKVIKKTAKKKSEPEEDEEDDEDFDLDDLDDLDFDDLD